MSGQPPDHRGPILVMVMLAIAGFIAVAGALGNPPVDEPPDPSGPSSRPSDGERHQPPRERRDHRRDGGGDRQQQAATFVLSVGDVGLAHPRPAHPAAVDMAP